MKKYHYVYKITNNNPTDQRKYYIGVRSSTVIPEKDTNYRSSSLFLKEAIKENGDKIFSKEILSIWKTRELANEEEVRLHNLYDVAVNPEFYNRAKSRGDGFCTEGMVLVLNKETGLNELVSKKISQNKSKYKSLMEDVVYATNTKTGEKVKVTKKEFRNNPNLKHSVKGTVTVIDTITGIRKQVSQEEFRNNSNLVGQLKGKVNVTDTRTGKRKSVKQEDFEKYDYYEQVTKGTLTVIDIRDNSTKKISLEDFYNNDFYIAPRSKLIGVYNEKHELVYVSQTKFKKYCIEKNMPYNAFAVSLQNNGKPLYADVGSNRKRLEEAGYLKYKGWYAKEIER